MEHDKYIVAEHWDMKAFIKAVNKHIEQGYIPIGAMTFSTAGNYYQAMLKEDIKHE